MADRTYLSTLWFSRLTTEEAEEFKKLLLSNTANPILRQLHNICSHSFDQLYSDVSEPEDSCWPLKRAHLDGRLRAYQEIMELLAFIKPQTKKE